MTIWAFEAAGPAKQKSHQLEKLFSIQLTTTYLGNNPPLPCLPKLISRINFFTI